MTEPQASGQRWIKGCAIGCGLLIFLAIVLVIVIVWSVQAGISKVEAKLVPYLESEYPTWKESGIITDEHAVLYDGLMDAVHSDESSGWTALCVTLLLTTQVEDDVLTAKEVEVADDLRKAIKESPELGFVFYVNLVSENPDIKKMSSKLSMLLAEYAKANPSG